jgi:hypothetical protein
MSKNMIQFQPGLSLAAFLKQYGTEEPCRGALYEWRWPKGTSVRNVDITVPVN